MNKKALDEKYSYQIDEHDVVHLFRGEDDCQQYLTNPLLSAIFKIETLEKENAELKNKLEHRNCLDCSNHYSNMKLLKAKKLLKTLLRLWNDVMTEETVKALIAEVEQFLEDNEKWN